MAKVPNYGFIHWHVSLLLVAYMFWSSATWIAIITRILLYLFLELIYISSLCIGYMKCSPNTVSIEGKKVIITGGNSGIGFSLAKEMVSAKASHVVLIARNKIRLSSCVDELNSIKSDGQTISYLSMDLSLDPVCIKQKVDELCVLIGGIDILINCAGYSIPGEFKDLELSAFSNMMNTNYLATVNITHAVVPHMIKQSFGQIAFVSSVAGQFGVYGFTAYAPSKYAIRGFAEVLYSELRPYGIGISIIFPPDTETPGLATENLRKPKVTQLISEQGGLWQADSVAKIIMNGIIARKYMIGCGSDGYFVNALTCGAAPASSTFEFWIQCMLMPVLRVYMLFMQTYFTRLVDQEHKKTNKKLE